MRQQIRTRRGAQRLPRSQARLRHSGLQRERHGTTRVLRQAEQTLPDPRAIQVDRDYVGAELQQQLEGPHGRPRPQEHEVAVAQVAPLSLVRGILDGLAGARLDGAVGDPPVDLVFELLAPQDLAFVRHLFVIISNRRIGQYLEFSHRHQVGFTLYMIGEGVDVLNLGQAWQRKPNCSVRKGTAYNNNETACDVVVSMVDTNSY